MKIYFKDSSYSTLENGKTFSVDEAKTFISSDIDSIIDGLNGDENDKKYIKEWIKIKEDVNHASESDILAIEEYCDFVGIKYEILNEPSRNNIKAINIRWDTDGDQEILKTLPTEVAIPNEITDTDEISDWLSDKIGYCHNGFEIEQKAKDNGTYDMYGQLHKNWDKYGIDYVVAEDKYNLPLRIKNVVSKDIREKKVFVYRKKENDVISFQEAKKEIIKNNKEYIEEDGIKEIVDLKEDQKGKEYLEKYYSIYLEEKIPVYAYEVIQLQNGKTFVIDEEDVKDDNYARYINYDVSNIENNYELIKGNRESYVIQLIQKEITDDIKIVLEDVLYPMDDNLAPVIPISKYSKISDNVADIQLLKDKIFEIDNERLGIRNEQLVSVKNTDTLKKLESLLKTSQETTRKIQKLINKKRYEEER